MCSVTATTAAVTREGQQCIVFVCVCVCVCVFVCVRGVYFESAAAHECVYLFVDVCIVVYVCLYVCHIQYESLFMSAVVGVGWCMHVRMCADYDTACVC